MSDAAVATPPPVVTSTSNTKPKKKKKKRGRFTPQGHALAAATKQRHSEKPPNASSEPNAYIVHSSFRLLSNKATTLPVDAPAAHTPMLYDGDLAVPIHLSLIFREEDVRPDDAGQAKKNDTLSLPHQALMLDSHWKPHKVFDFSEKGGDSKEIEACGRHARRSDHAFTCHIIHYGVARGAFFKSAARHRWAAAVLLIWAFLAIVVVTNAFTFPTRRVYVGAFLSVVSPPTMTGLWALIVTRKYGWRIGELMERYQRAAGLIAEPLPPTSPPTPLSDSSADDSAADTQSGGGKSKGEKIPTTTVMGVPVEVLSIRDHTESVLFAVQILPDWKGWEWAWPIPWRWMVARLGDSMLTAAMRFQADSEDNVLPTEMASETVFTSLLTIDRGSELGASSWGSRGLAMELRRDIEFAVHKTILRYLIEHGDMMAFLPNVPDRTFSQGDFYIVPPGNVRHKKVVAADQ